MFFHAVLELILLLLLPLFPPYSFICRLYRPICCDVFHVQPYFLFVDAILSGIEKRLGGAAAKKGDAEDSSDADDFEADVKDAEAKQKAAKMKEAA